MKSRWTVHRSDERHLDVEDIHKDLFPFAINLVIALRAEEVEAIGTDRFHVGGATAGQDDDAIIRIGADRVKKIDKLLVGISVEDERIVVGVKSHFQYARFGTGETG